MKDLKIKFGRLSITKRSGETMNNVCHYHQIDEENFQRCCNPSCDIPRDRMKKYQLLRSKENQLIEKYENAMKIHDTIAKRRQSVDIGRHMDPLKSTKNMDKLRRFSVPNKPKSKKSLSLQPTFFTRLETLTDDELENIYQENERRTNYINNNKTYRRRHDNRNNLRVQENTNNHISTLRKLSVTPTPRSDRSPIIMKKLSQSMDNLLNDDHFEVNNNNNNNTLPARKSPRLSHSNRKTSRYLEISKSLPLASHYRKNRVLPYHQRFLEAKRKFDARKSMLTSLDMDIHKVTLILRKMKSRSLPNLLDPDLLGKEKGILKRSSTLDDVL